MNVLVKYWQGKVPIWVSLWGIFVGLLVFMSIVEPVLLKSLFPLPKDRIVPTIIVVAVTMLLIFPWQLVGLVRATDRYYIKYGHTLRTRGIQFIMFLGLIFIVVFSIETLQKVISTSKKTDLEQVKEEIPKYALVLKQKPQRLLISGEFEIGITEAVHAVLKLNPRLKIIRLESTGGSIYEGRGLSALFTHNNLSTFVSGECSSACATAFIGGIKRYLGSEGKIGFHQYTLDLRRFPKAVPFHDVANEQDRDLKIFQSQGIEQSFLSKVFNQPASSIWFPTSNELLNAGVVHEIKK